MKIRSMDARQRRIDRANKKFEWVVTWAAKNKVHLPHEQMFRKAGRMSVDELFRYAQFLEHIIEIKIMDNVPGNKAFCKKVLK